MAGRKRKRINRNDDRTPEVSNVNNDIALMKNTLNEKIKELSEKSQLKYEKNLDYIDK